MAADAPTDQDSYQLVVHCLGRVRRRLVGRSIATALVKAGTVWVVLVVAWIGLEAVFFFSPLWRTLAAWMIGGCGLAALAVDVTRRLRGKLSLHDIGLLAERRQPLFRQRLITTLELQPGHGGGLYSSELIEATATAAARMVGQTEPGDLVGDGMLRSRLWRWVAAAGASLALFGLLRDEMIPALDRCLHPTLAYTRAAATSVETLSGDLEIVKGDDAVIYFRVGGELPRTARILRRESPQMPWEQEEVLLRELTAGPADAGTSDSLRYVFAAVRRPLTYQVQAGDGASVPARIEVIDPPVVQRLRVHYAFPPYTGLADRIDEVSGDVRGIVGTRVEIEMVSSKPLSAATVVIDDSLRLPARLTDDTATVSWVLSVADSSRPAPAPRVHGTQYHIELVDRKGIANRNPIRYTIRPLIDEVPRVAITEPGHDADLPEHLEVVLGVEALDDFGLTEIALVYRINDGDDHRLTLAKGGEREQAILHAWDLSAADLLPEDLIHYYCEVADNDRVSGPKKGRSREFAFRYPSLYELVSELAAERADQIEALEELADEGDTETGEIIEQIRRELLKKEELTWQQQKQLEATIEAQQEKAAAVAELAEQMAETLQALQESGLASEEILDKLQEIRELMQEITSPEMQEALASLQEAMRDLEPRELAETLADFAADHEAFQQRLDRTLALLRQVDVEQRLEAAVSQAQDLLSRQEKIDATLDEPGQEPSLKLQMQAANLSEDTEVLQQELEQLGDDTRPYSEGTAEALQSTAAAMQERRLSGRMKELAARLGSQHEQARARQLGQDLEEELGSLSSGLEQIQQEFIAAQKQDLLRALREAIESLVGLSFSQEELRDRTNDQRRLTATPPQLAEEQFALLNGTGSLIDQLATVGRRTVNLNLGLPTTLGYVLRNMKEATTLLGAGDGGRSLPHQQQALKHLNEAVLLLRESADDIRESRTPSGFGEAMEKMMGLSEQQADLNQATQQALGQGSQPGRNGRGSQDWRAQMDRLALQQRRIQSALSELERGLRGHRGAQRRLAQIEEEMGTVVKEMNQRRPSPRLAQSQQRILQRMLDASRSVHTRGFKQERLAETGVDQAYTGPSWLPRDLGQAPDELREAMKHALAGDYPHEYWEVIRRYYELVYADVAQGALAPGDGSALP